MPRWGETPVAKDLFDILYPAHVQQSSARTLPMPDGAREKQAYEARMTRQILYHKRGGGKK
jgi:hypothetical protein